MTLASGIIGGQSLGLVALAGPLCVAGAWATSRFFQRLTDARGALGCAWLFLTSLVSGVTIWCTHFIAMLGYRPGMATSFGWFLTGASFLIAFLGTALGFLIAAGDTGRWRVRPAVGGAVVGLAVSAMHYVGMQAMHMDGTASLDHGRVALSVVLGVVFGAAALHSARSGSPYAGNLMWALLSAAVLLMHFTGVSAMQVHLLPDTTGGLTPMPDMPGMPGGAGPTSHTTQPRYVLAAAIATMSFLTIGVGAVGYLIDQSRAQSVERLRRLAMYDELTGLPNRANLSRRLAEEIEHARLNGHSLALVVIDVDNFKEINDLYGHPIGDEVLRVLGAQMAILARRDERRFIARIGGDEFVALCPLDDVTHLRPCLEELHHTISVSIPIGADTIAPRASIGAATFPGDATNADTLVNNADLAMYRAKSDPLLDVCVYDAEVDERTRLRRGLTADLREALDRGQLSLHYQPQTAVRTGATIGYEALLRWQHPQLGAVSPAEFIPLAEDSGLIVPIGAWVLRTACIEAAGWHPPLRVSVNVSAVQLAEPGLIATVEEALATSGLPADRLELEMTETAVFTNREQALAVLREIKALGVGLAIDDFGVGYSSLDALRSFPFDRIKIDRSFFSGKGTPEQTVELVQTMVSLGRTFGMSVLAEGIETPEQLALLNDAGCHEAQGYLFGRPAPLAEIVGSGRLAITGPQAGQAEPAEPAEHGPGDVPAPRVLVVRPRPPHTDAESRVEEPPGLRTGTC